MKPALVACCAMLALAGCDKAGDGSDGDTVRTVNLPGRPGDPEPPPPPMPGPTEVDLAMMRSGDCRTVAEAYTNAIYRKSFAFAEMFWIEGAADAEALDARYGEYPAPRFTIASLREGEGAAGGRRCTITGALADPSRPEVPLREGKLVLEWQDGASGGDKAQPRWRVHSETLAEPMELAGGSKPA